MEDCIAKMSPNGTAKLKILIVEDSPADRKIMKMLLSGSSLPISELKFAEDLENALELSSDGAFDVVLLDLNLPDSSGIDTLVKISDKCPHAANIVVTGLDHEEVGLGAVSKGAHEYLVKGTFDAQMLTKTVQYAIERKKAQEVIRESDAQHRLLFEAANEAIFLTEADQFVNGNPATLEIFGCTKEQIVGQSLHELLPDVQPNGRDSMELVQEKNNLALEGKPQLFECRYIRRDGTPFEAEVSLNRLELSGQMFLQNIVRDVTERKRSAEAIKSAYERLENANQELKEVQSQLVQNEKLASIGQLAAGVAHEMNTPVGFVDSNFNTLENYVGKFLKLLEIYDGLVGEIESSGQAQLLEKVSEIRKSKDALKIDFILEDIQGLFDESREGLHRVTSIIQNLRDFSRIDQAEEFGEYNLNNGIEATLVVARNEIKYDADVNTEFSDIPPVSCNPSQINQVFLNILVNAAQAIKSQQRDDRGAITIRTSATDDEVLCEITDDGPGMSPETQQKVFDPFFTTKPAGKGTGLGLSISYDIVVNKHKGQLLLDSEVGKGTKFTIKLPIAKSKEGNKEEMLVGAVGNGQ